MFVEEDAADLAGAGEHGQDAGVDRSGVLGVREPEPSAHRAAGPGSHASAHLHRGRIEVEGVGRAGVSSWWWAGGVEACGGEVFGGGGDDDLDVGVRPDPHTGWPPDLKLPFSRWRVTVLGKVLVMAIPALGKVGILNPIIDAFLNGGVNFFAGSGGRVISFCSSCISSCISFPVWSTFGAIAARGADVSGGVPRIGLRVWIRQPNQGRDRWRCGGCGCGGSGRFGGCGRRLRPGRPCGVRPGCVRRAGRVRRRPRRSPSRAGARRGRRGWW